MQQHLAAIGFKIGPCSGGGGYDDGFGGVGETQGRDHVDGEGMGYSAGDECLPVKYSNV